MVAQFVMVNIDLGKNTSSSVGSKLGPAGDNPNCRNVSYLFVSWAWFGEDTSEKFGSPEQYPFQ
jgi:hypothetical protein